MGFMDMLGNMGQAALNKMERMKELRDEFRTYDDDRLIAIYRHDSGTRKQVAAAVLKERGYGR